MTDDKSTENSRKKSRGNPQNLIPWQPGQSGNPKGRKLGQRNRKTVIMDALKRLAEVNKLSPEDLEEMLHATGIQQAIKGSVPHYKEIADGLYGKLTDKMDLTSGGKTLADLISIADGKPHRGEATPEV